MVMAANLRISNFRRSEPENPAHAASDRRPDAIPMPAPSLLLKRRTAPSRKPNSPWRGAPTPGRCSEGLGVDNRAIEATDATAPREAILGPPLSTASSPRRGFGGSVEKQPTVDYSHIG
jgi:hypothetical protein